MSTTHDPQHHPPVLPSIKEILQALKIIAESKPEDPEGSLKDYKWAASKISAAMEITFLRS
jgi:hypothetical protein